MASILSNYCGNGMLAAYFTSKKTYLALHRADPTNTGDPSTEFVGGGYIRQLATWSVASNKTIATTNTQIFNDLPAGTLAFLAAWDSQVGGNMLIRYALSPTIAITASGRFTSVAGDVAFVI